MTNKKITDLPSALTAGITDEVEIVQGGVSKRVTIARFLGVTFPFAPAPITTIGPVTASKLVGRGSAAGAGALQEITLGTGLTMVGTTLNASGGGGSTSFGDGWDWSTSTSNLLFVSPISGNNYLSIDDDIVNGVSFGLATNGVLGLTSATELQITAGNVNFDLNDAAPAGLTAPGLLTILTPISGANASIWGWTQTSPGKMGWSTFLDGAVIHETFMEISRTAGAVTQVQLTALGGDTNVDLATDLTLTGSGTVTVTALTGNINLTTAQDINIGADIDVQIFSGDTVVDASATLGLRFFAAPGTPMVLTADNINFVTSTQNTVGAAGGASALPATPSGYIHVQINGGNFQIPYYAR